MKNKDNNKDLLEWYQDFESTGKESKEIEAVTGLMGAEQNVDTDGKEKELPCVAVSVEKPQEDKVDVKSIEMKAEVFKALTFAKALQDVVARHSDVFHKLADEEKEKIKDDVKALADKIIRIIDGI